MHYLERIWQREQDEKARRDREETQSRAWAEDLRWRYVYGSIKPYGYEGLMEATIQVRFDGELYTSQIRFLPKEADVRDILDACTHGIDKLMEDNGVPPYKIASHS